MRIRDWWQRRTGRGPVTSSREAAAQLGRARRYDAKLAEHRPLRGGDHGIDPRSGLPPTP